MGQTDRQTDRRTDGRTSITPLVCVCISQQKLRKSQMDLWLEESSSDDDFVESDVEDERRRADQAATDTDHWLIQKLIRYIKVPSVGYCSALL